jgi:hypothetical protein
MTDDYTIPSDPDEILAELERLVDQGCEHCAAMITDRGPDGEDQAHWWQCGLCANQEAFKITYLRDLAHRLAQLVDNLPADLADEEKGAAKPADKPPGAGVAAWGRARYGRGSARAPRSEPDTVRAMEAAGLPSQHRGPLGVDCTPLVRATLRAS